MPRSRARFNYLRNGSQLIRNAERIQVREVTDTLVKSYVVDFLIAARYKYKYTYSSLLVLQVGNKQRRKMILYHAVLKPRKKEHIWEGGLRYTYVLDSIVIHNTINEKAIKGVRIRILNEMSGTFTGDGDDA